MQTFPIFWILSVGLISLLAGYGFGYWVSRMRCRHQFLQESDRLRQSLVQLQAKVEFLETGIGKRETIESQLRLELETSQQEKVRLQTLLQEAKALESSMAVQFENLSQNILKNTLKELEDDAQKEYTEKQTALNQNLAELLRPLREIIERQDQKVKEIEKQHGEQTVSLRDSIKLMLDHCRELNVTNVELKKALMNSKGRGDWGELELIRLLEESGLTPGVHYEAQRLEVGLRPDIKIKLPNGRFIYVDAKTILVNLERLVALSEGSVDGKSGDQERKNHANALEREILSLNRKAYDTLVDGGIDFVVLYVPRESMLRVALEEKPFLMEQAFKKRVVLASPLILMALLKTVALGWDQVTLSRNAEEIRKLAQELHKRSSLFLERFQKVGERLNMAAKEYQDAQTAFSGRQGLIPHLRKIEEYGCKSEKEIPAAYADLEAIEESFLGFVDTVH